MDKCTCICCGTILDAEFSDNSNPLVISPVYDGLIFRATGNFGSTIFDSMPMDCPRPREEILQVIICDECMRDRIDLVSHIQNIKETVTADIGKFVL